MSRESGQASAAPRRAFLGRLAASIVALGATGRPLAAAGNDVDGSPAAADAWTARLTGKHKAVFDAPEIAEGIVVANAWVFLHSYATAERLRDAELSAVVVIRHAAIPLVLDDAMWEKYDVGRHVKLKDQATKKWARRNVLWKAAAGDPASAPYTLDALRARGVILLGCDLALKRMIGTIAKRTDQRPEAVGEELRAHLIPGLELAPSGIYAVTRAQELGCSYVRST